MQVLKTTSPFWACSSGAPKRIPSYVAPDSRARRPRTSGIGDQLRGDWHARQVLMDHAAAGQGEQDRAVKRRAEQWRVARERLQWCRADDPFGVGVEQRAGRRLPDA